MSKQPIAVSIPELTDILEKYLEADAPVNYAVKIVGHPGIGKSDVVRQTAARKGFLFMDTRLAFKENIDLGGYPVPDHQARRMLYYRPAFIPPPEVPEGFAGIVWFLDEANRAHPTVIQTLFQIITEHICGEHPLPEKTFVVLAGNLGEEDSTSLTEFDDAALDGRLAVLHLRPDAQNWLEWAGREGIHPSIIQYISSYPERLWDEAAIHPNPRGWHQASQAITLSYKIDSPGQLAAHLREPNGSSLEKMIQALVGQVASSDFVLQVSSPRLLSTAQVLEGDGPALERVRQGSVSPEDILWAVSGALGALRQANILAKGRLEGPGLAQLANTLRFIGLTRADMRMSFFYLLLKRCALFTRIPQALEMLGDKALAAELARKLQALLEE